MVESFRLPAPSAPRGSFQHEHRFDMAPVACAGKAAVGPDLRSMEQSQDVGPG